MAAGGRTRQDRYKQNEIGVRARERERQCGRFLKFLIIIAILFPSSKSLFVAHFYLWSFIRSFFLHLLFLWLAVLEREWEREENTWNSLSYNHCPLSSCGFPFFPLRPLSLSHPNVEKHGSWKQFVIMLPKMHTRKKRK